MLRSLLSQMCAGFALRRDNRVLIALIYCHAFASLGLCIASLGPALLELAVQTGSSLRDTGYCFAGRSAGYLIGSFSGPLYDRMPGHLVLGGGLLGAGIGSLLIPVVTNVYLLGALVSLQGMAMGFCDTGSNVLLIYLFGKEVGPWMQFMHFSFAAGAFVAPMLLRASEGTAAVDYGENGDASVGPRLASKGSSAPAFYTIGAFCCVIALMIWSVSSPRARGDAAASGHDAPTAPAADKVAQATLVSNDANSTAVPDAWQTINPESAATPQIDADARPVETTVAAAPPDGAHDAHASSAPLPRATARLRLIVVVIVAMLLFQYVGCETGFGAYITAYAVIALGQAEGDGQVLAGLYWGAIMLGRLAAVPISMKVHPRPYLGASMIGCVVGMVILLIGQSSVGAVWFGTIVYGLCMACVFPTAIALAETIFPVTGRDATFFVIGAATGEMLIPFIISTLFGNVPGSEAETGIKPASSSASVGPPITLWLVGIVCALNVGTYYLLVKYGARLSTALSAPRAALPAAATP